MFIKSTLIKIGQSNNTASNIFQDTLPRLHKYRKKRIMFSRKNLFVVQCMHLLNYDQQNFVRPRIVKDVKSDPEIVDIIERRGYEFGKTHFVGMESNDAPLERSHKSMTIDLLQTILDKNFVICFILRQNQDCIFLQLAAKNL